MYVTLHQGGHTHIWHVPWLHKDFYISLLFVLCFIWRLLFLVCICIYCFSRHDWIFLYLGNLRNSHANHLYQFSVFLSACKWYLTVTWKFEAMLCDEFRNYSKDWHQFKKRVHLTPRIVYLYELHFCPTMWVLTMQVYLCYTMSQNFL